ncbi:MAG: hypothetical protein ABS949_03905 [Solibacillus sp.]
MKRYVYTLLMIGIVVILFNTFSNRATRDLALEKSLIELLEQGEKEIDLSELTTFDWIKVELFPPYTHDEVIEETMDITFKGDNGNIDLFDCCFLVVFANDNYAVKTVMLPMHRIDSIRDERVLVGREK